MSEQNKRNEGRGFAGMDDDRQREIASQGGKAAHDKGTAHEFTPEEAREAGRKGGESGRSGGGQGGESGRSGGGQSGGSGRSGGGQGDESSTRGGSSEQHAKAGRQSHKND